MAANSEYFRITTAIEEKEALVRQLLKEQKHDKQPEVPGREHLVLSPVDKIAALRFSSDVNKRARELGKKANDVCLTALFYALRDLKESDGVSYPCRGSGHRL